jgi:hypothetical protein
MSKDGLYSSIINDRAARPERLNATLERVAEVATIVLKDRAAEVLERWRDEIGDERAPLTETQGSSVANVLREICSQDELEAVTAMLDDSELATGEAVSLHREYKIPVSRLEDDIVPVRGRGAWITDTRGRNYLDMDSNYSATNLGMSNPEIARGIFNQANQLISMKEDRVHIPRARFLKTIQPMMPPGLSYFY